jgi:hypothetical protein
MRLRDNPDTLTIVGLGGALVAVLMVDQQITFFCALWLAIIIGYWAWERRKLPLNVRMWTPVTLALVFAAFPAYLLYYRPLSRATGYEVPGAVEALNYSMPVSSLLNFPLMWRVYGLVLPITFIAALAGSWRYRLLRLWIIGSLLFVTLTFGPVLRGTHFPLPFAFLRLLPGLSHFRTPYRFVMPAALGMTIATALVLGRIARGLPARTARWAGVAMIGLVVADAVAHRLFIGFQTQTMPSDPVYAQIAQDSRDCLVLEDRSESEREPSGLARERR